MSHLGTVSTFDEPAGLGTVRDESGREHPFHCTALLDGSRSVAVGAQVGFVLVPAHLGRYEAHQVRVFAQDAPSLGCESS